MCWKINGAFSDFQNGNLMILELSGVHLEGCESQAFGQD
jgi:hypothetical protein